MSSTENTRAPALSPTLREGLLHLRSGCVAEAEAAFRSALESQQGQSAQAHNLLGTLCYNQGRLDGAQQHPGATVAA